MARPFILGPVLWHHVSILADVDGFVIPSPTWLPRFVHVILSLFISTVLYFHGFSSSPLSLFLLLSSSREGEIASPSLTIFLSSSLLSLSLSFSSSLSLATEISVARRDFFFSLLFFLSLSPSLPRLRVSLSLATEISVERRDFFFSLLSLFRKLFPSFSLSSFSRSPLLPLSHVLLPLSVCCFSSSV